MRKNLVALPLLLLCIHACVRSEHPQQVSTKSSAEQEIRAALCEIDQGKYATAQERVEKIIQSDPRNIYAQRLLPGIMNEQIKIGDESPENIALIRKTIEAYERALNNLLNSSEEKAGVERHVLLLYEWISPEEQHAELLRRASDSNGAPAKRGEFYAVLASKAWSCAYEMTSKQSSLGKSEIEKAKECVTKGLDYANQAIILAPNSEAAEAAWSYKAKLFSQASTLAGIENDQTQKVSYQKQYGEALKRVEEISAQQAKEREDKWKKEEASSRESDDKEQLSKELKEYTTENPLAEAVSKIYIPLSIELSSLVAPIPIAPSPAAPSLAGSNPEKEREAMTPKPQKGCFREIDGPAQVEEKRDWKSFSPVDEDIIVDLPDNVCPSAGGYTAASEGVVYTIFSQPRSVYQTPSKVDDGALNSLAWAFVDVWSRNWLRNASGNSFEAKLLRKEIVSGQPSRVYSFGLKSCSKRKDGMVVVYAAKTRNYTLIIAGANESDQRAQRFLKSVRFK